MTNELIKIQTNEQGQKLVSGRELHEVLKVEKAFSTWMQTQLENVDAIEGQDYTTYWGDSFKGNVVEFQQSPQYMSSKGYTREYVLGLDIAKEICMCVGVAPRTNEETKRLSKQVRKYFIECEKQLQTQIPQLSERDYAILTIMNATNDVQRVGALKQFEEIITKPLLETIEVQEETIKEQQPCVDYVDAVTANDDSLLVREVAKISYKQTKIQIGERKLYNKLREWKWVCKYSTEPTQYALNQGYLEVHSRIVSTPYGQKEVSTTMVKPKGQVYIVQRLMREAKGE